MKTAIAIAAAGLMSFGVIDTASAAFELNPESTSFTGTGTTSATKNGITLMCNATFKGKVNSAGVGKVTGGSFSGQVGCSSVGLSNLPWKSVAINATQVKIHNVTFTSPIGNCGPGNLTVGLSGGVISFNNQALPGGCTVSGSITTTPSLSIVNDAPWWKEACGHMSCAPAFRVSKP